MNLSFAGCGFLGIYHVGVASCLKEYAPQLAKGHIAGASAGAIAAVCLMNDLDLGDCTNYVLRIATQARKRALGPLHPSFNISQIVSDGLHDILPDHAHKVCSGRLYVSLTRVSDNENVLITDFDTKDDLIQALICSAHVPFYSGLVPPAYKGVRYWDGGLSDNIPCLNEDTVTVSPFAGECDICPNDSSSNLLHVSLANMSIQCTARNLYRMLRVLFPPHPEVLSEMCRQGFDDTLRFLQKNSLITCVKHLSIVSSIQAPPASGSLRVPHHHHSSDHHHSDHHHHGSSDHHHSTSEHHHHSADHHHHSMSDHHHYHGSSDRLHHHALESHRRRGSEIETACNLDVDSMFDSGVDCSELSCRECEYKQQLASMDSLPPPVIQALQAACARNSLLAHIYNHRLYKTMALAFSPWILPIDIAYNIVSRFIRYIPYIAGDGQWVAQQLPDITRAILQFISTHVFRGKKHYSARFRCHMNIREVETKGRTPSVLQAGPKEANRCRNLNLDFAVQFETHQHSNRRRSSTDSMDQFEMVDPVECLHELEHRVIHEHQHHRDHNTTTTSDESLNNRDHHSVESMEYNDSLDNVIVSDPVVTTDEQDSQLLDTFDSYLERVEEMETIMAFYYRDEYDNIKVTEIRRATPRPSPASSSSNMVFDFNSTGTSLLRRSSTAHLVSSCTPEESEPKMSKIAVSDSCPELVWDDYQQLEDERLSLRDLEDMNIQL